MDILILIIALALLCFFAFKGVPTFFNGLLVAAMLCLYFRMPIYETLSQTYMPGVANYVGSYLMLFVAGAALGKIMDVSGAADVIAESVLKSVGAKRVVLGIALVTAILTIAGVSTFVCIFAVFPIAKRMCEMTNMPRETIVFANSVGANAASIAPFVPSVNNSVAAESFGVTVAAAAVPGIISAVIYFIVSYLFVEWYTRRSVQQGRVYVATEKDRQLEQERAEIGNSNVRPSLFMSVLPIIVLLVVLNVLHFNVVTSIFIGCLCAILCTIKSMPRDWNTIKKLFVTVVDQGVKTNITTAAIVGFGKVVTATAGYAIVQDSMNAIQASPLVSAALITTVMAGICGSASGGISIAAPIVAENFMTAANAQALARVSVIASFGLDSLPNNGFMQTKFGVCDVTFKEAYPVTFVITVLFPLAICALCIVLCTMMGMG